MLSIRQLPAGIAAALLFASGCGDGTEPSRAVALAFTSQPSSTSAVTPFSVTVAITDADGSTVTNADDDVTISLAPGTSGSATLMGVRTVAAVNGIAVFSNLAITNPRSGYALTAASGTLTSATSEAFSIVAGPAAKLGVVTQPPGTSAALPIPTVRFAVQDAVGNIITTASHTVTVSVNGTATTPDLSGSTSAVAQNGIATFSNLGIQTAGLYTLTAKSADLAPVTTTPFVVSAAGASRLIFVTQPTSAVANTAFSPAITVAVADGFGNIVTTATNQILLSMTNPPGVFLSGSVQAQAINGIATFSNVRLDKAGTGYTMNAFSSGLAPTNSAPFSILFGAPSKLGFVSQPLTTSPGALFSPVVSVSVQDAGGNTVATAPSTTITVAFGSNPGGATLAGTTTAQTVNGIATFPDLRINTPSTGYTLAALATGLTTGVSSLFAIRDPIVFASIAAGYFHTCGIATNGNAWCWGSITVTPGSLFPVPTTPPQNFVSISSGRDHSCGLTGGGVAYCWGANFSGQLGSTANGSTAFATAVSGGLTFASVSAGYSHSCGVTPAGAAYCWGNNALGALGMGGTAPNVLAPGAVVGGLTFRNISAGRDFTCGVTTTSVGYCWGDNADSELGDGTTARRTTPVPVLTPVAFQTIGAGGFHGCALTAAGVAYCWGSNNWGQLGDGTVIPRAGAGLVSGSMVFTSITVGNRHNCGLTTSGTAFCWGDNANGQLGDDTFVPRYSPTPVTGGLTFASINAGRFHTCGVTTSGEGYCWGQNPLGDGTANSSAAPVRIR